MELAGTMRNSLAVLVRHLPQRQLEHDALGGSASQEQAAIKPLACRRLRTSADFTDRGGQKNRRAALRRVRVRVCLRIPITAHAAHICQHVSIGNSKPACRSSSADLRGTKACGSAV
jgi:hypothetical protein